MRIRLYLLIISIFNFFTLIVKHLRAFGLGAIEIVIYYYYYYYYCYYYYYYYYIALVIGQEAVLSL